MTLRPYQREAVNAVEAEWASGHKRTLITLPTASGKTIIFGQVVADAVKDGSKALILAHREELLSQAADKILKAYGLQSALEKASSHASGSVFPITVGSVQTLCKTARLEEYPHDYFKTIIVDEAHHIMSDTYQKVMSWFPDANVLGVTATPDRADKKNLGRFFESQAYEYNMRQGIKDGYLSPVKAQMIPLVDVSNVHQSNGDYSLGESANALEPYLNQIATEMTKYCKDRKTVVFLPLIKISQEFRDMLNDRGFRAAEVNGNSEDRAEILKDFENGRYNVLCNSMLLTEGWDCPAVDCIIMLRPTKIRSLYQQCVGRGMRLAPGKDFLLLLDFLWLSEKHDLCRPAHLIAESEEIAERITKDLEKSGSAEDLTDAESSAKRNIVEERKQALAAEFAANSMKQGKLIDPTAFSAFINDESLMDYVPAFGWETAKPTQKQLDLLEKSGIRTDSIESSGLASKLIDKVLDRKKKGLATPKQIRLLMKYGFRDLEKWSFSAANKMITIISTHGWRVPSGFDPWTYIPEDMASGSES